MQAASHGQHLACLTVKLLVLLVLVLVLGACRHLQ
jgi:hypothetical protein